MICERKFSSSRYWSARWNSYTFLQRHWPRWKRQQTRWVLGNIFLTALWLAFSKSDIILRGSSESVNWRSFWKTRVYEDSLLSCSRTYTNGTAELSTNGWMVKMCRNILDATLNVPSINQWRCSSRILRFSSVPNIMIRLASWGPESHITKISESFLEHPLYVDFGYGCRIQLRIHGFLPYALDCPALWCLVCWHTYSFIAASTEIPHVLFAIIPSKQLRSYLFNKLWHSLI